jgi:phospholipid/cholesterol/gamma-HCH transport system ATP-binding protein
MKDGPGQGDEEIGVESDASEVVGLRDVHKSFGSLVVLDGVTVSLNRGETTVVIGESGVGKSVILKHTVGLLRPDTGSVWFGGQRIDDLPERELSKIRRRFGFLFQMGALFDSLSAGENIAFPLRESGMRDKREIRRIVDEKLAMVGLNEVREKRPAELSGGQRKRVALARAIALNPEVILYDEPTTGLDPVRSDVINELILKLKRELQVTSIVVTHDMASVFKVADRILMLYKGKFIFDGTAAQIRESGDERVRRFIDGRASREDLAGLRNSGGQT